MDTFSQPSDDRRRLSARRIEDLTRTVLEVCPMPLLVKDELGRFVLANSAAASLLGRPVHELIGRTEEELFAPEIAHRHREEDSWVLDQRCCFRGEEWLDGNNERGAGTFLVRKVSTLDSRGAPLVVCTLTDVRALKTAEHEARMADERDARSTAILRSVLDSSEAAIFSIDRGYRYTTFNAAQAQMVRDLYGAQAVLGEPISTGVPDAAWSEMKQFLDRALAGESFVNETASGSSDAQRMFEVFFRPVREPGGEIVGVAIFARETTERRRAEAALEASEDRLRQAQKMDAVGRLAGGVAHDLNNMLTVVLSSVSFMQAMGVNEGAFGRDVEEIGKAAERARALTAQLLSFSRRQPVNPVLFEVNTRLGELSQLLHRILGEDIKLVLDLCTGIGSVLADPGAFDQAMMNLIVNARDAMPRGGTITIATSDAVMREGKLVSTVCTSERTHTMISVTDTGTGMTPEVLEHLFEPFFTTKEKGKGTGLGLAIVYGAIRQAHGFIEVRSRPGFGSTFSLYLPIGKAMPRVNPRAPDRFMPARAGEQVLLVEDDEQVMSAAARALQLFGYRVSTASTLDEAIACASRARPSVLVADVVLPEHDGLAVARAVQQVAPGVPVLFMSGFPEDVLLRHGVPEGAFVLAKPFTPDTLGRRVRQVIDAAAQANPAEPAPADVRPAAPAGGA